MSVNVGVDCREVGTNAINNTSQVYLKIWITTSGESFNNNTQEGTIDFNGVPNTVSYTLPKNSETTVFEQTIDVVHDSSGNGSCSWSYSLPTTPAGGTKLNSGSITLTHIDRNTNILKFSVLSKGLNNVQLEWATSDSINAVEYKIGNSEWLAITGQQSIWNDFKNGWFYVLNLNPNTMYNFKIRVRKEGTELWTESGILMITTYDIPRINSIDNFIHGDNAFLNITNPSNSIVKLTMKIKDNIILNRENAKTGKNTIVFTEEELDNIYKKYDKNNSLTATFIVTTGNYENSKNCTIILNGNQKTVHVEDNNTIKRAKAYVEVDGAIKRAVVWVGVDRKPKRCI